MNGAGSTPMRFHVDAWDPTYGTSVADIGSMDTSTATVDPDVEVPTGAWRPLDPCGTGDVPDAVVFIDGVRRVDARVWIDDPSGVDATPAVAGTYAAGAVCCCSGVGAHLVAHDIRRGLFTVAAHAMDLVTRAGAYPARITHERSGVPVLATLETSVFAALAEAEHTIAVEAAQHLTREHATPPDSHLLVVDGPLRSPSLPARSLGYVKTHQSAYLTPLLHAMVASLLPAQRTPVFRIGTNWDRLSWYLRLPGTPGAPWAGVVRVEASATLPIPEVVELAGLTQSLLPRFASVEYKDSRAPQNLMPIAGLERRLRHLLGDRELAYRALRVAASS